MADIIIDMQDGDAEEAAGQLIPVNTAATAYKAKIEVCDLTTPKQGDNKGKPMYALRVRLLDGPAKGRVMFANACLWYEARFTIVQIMDALGFPIDKKLKVPAPARLINRELGVVVKHGVNQFDEQRHEVGKFVKIKGADGAPATDSSKGQRVSF